MNAIEHPSPRSLEHLLAPSGSSGLVFQRILPDYRIGFFRSLADTLGLQLCYWPETSPPQGKAMAGSSWAIPMPGRHTGKAPSDWLRIFRLLRARKPASVVCEASVGFPVFWLLILLRPWLRFRLLAWGHGMDNRDWARKKVGWRFRLLAFALRGTDGIILYSPLRAAAMAKYLPWLRITVAPNSLDTEELARLAGPPVKDGSQSPTDTLKLVFLGRLIPGKRLDLAILALKRLKVGNWHFRIIGDGPERPRLEKLSGGDSRIDFAGEIRDPARIGAELSRADLMLHPGNLGLVVIHASCCGCPILTCHSGMKGIEHGPEYELVPEGSCVLCAPDADAIRNTLETLSADRPGLVARGSLVREHVVNCTGFDRMLEGFLAALSPGSAEREAAGKDPVHRMES